MKTQFPVLFAILVLFPRLAAAQIYLPQPGDLKLAASFDFAVGNRVLNPGNYLVHSEKSSGKLQICEDGIICETVEATALRVGEVPAQPKLVFSRYGDKHFLLQIWFPDGTGLQLHAPFLDSLGGKETKPELVYVSADLLCIHTTRGLPLSWH